MIYLIDDNKNDKRIKEFGISFVEDDVFKTVLTSLTKLKQGCDLSFLMDAQCILIHKTTEDCDENDEYIEKSNSNAKEIIENISDYGANIPLVIFSYRMENIVYSHHEQPNCVYQIKKDIFYKRLLDFVQHYEKSGEIELRIIAYGINYLSAEVGEIAKRLIDDIIRQPPSSKFEIRFINEKLLQSFFRFLRIDTSFKDFRDDLEKGQTSNKQFIENINSVSDSINQYGKNIYNWKK